MYAEDLLTKEDVTLVERTPGGELRVNIGDTASDKGEVAGASLWCSDGFYGAPNNPTPEGACMAIVHRDGPTVRVLATRDNRYTSRYASLEPGDRAIVSDCKARFLLKKGTHSMSMYTQDEDDNAIIFDVSGDSKAITAMIGGADGTTILEMKSGEIKLTAGKSSLTINSDGITVLGPAFNAATGGGRLGTVGGAPATLPIVHTLTGVSTGWFISS